MRRRGLGQRAQRLLQPGLQVQRAVGRHHGSFQPRQQGRLPDGVVRGDDQQSLADLEALRHRRVHDVVHHARLAASVAVVQAGEVDEAEVVAVHVEAVDQRRRRSGQRHRTPLLRQGGACEEQVASSLVERLDVLGPRVRSVAQAYEASAPQRRPQRPVALAEGQSLGTGEEGGPRGDEQLGFLHGLEGADVTPAVSGRPQGQLRSASSSTGGRPDRPRVTEAN